MRRVILSVFLIGVLGSELSAQNFLSWRLEDRYFSAHAGIGFASYRGELKHNNSFQGEISNVTLGLEARLTSKVAVRLDMGTYTLRGHDKHAADSSFARQRNLSFSSRNFDFSLKGIFYLKSYRGDYFKRPRLDPYILGGIGATFISPTAELGEQSFKLYDLNTENTDYSRMTMIFPVGAGLKWKITSFVNIITEINYSFTLSDYLDDVSGNYPESYPNLVTELLGNRKDEIPTVNEAAYDQLVAGQPRGDSSDKDKYITLNLKLEFFLPPNWFGG